MNEWNSGVLIRVRIEHPIPITNDYMKRGWWQTNSNRIFGNLYSGEAPWNLVDKHDNGYIRPLVKSVVQALSYPFLILISLTGPGWPLEWQQTILPFLAKYEKMNSFLMEGEVPRAFRILFLEVWLSGLRHWFAKSTCKNPFFKDWVG
jgi:hypothetical protein